jgi:type IV pilus assembly protein PilB
MARKRRRLGEILQRWGLITEAQAEEAVKMSQGANARIGEMLVELGYASTTDVAKALASQFGYEYIDLDAADAVDRDQLSLMPMELIKKHMVLPLGQEGGRLKVLIHDPMDLETLDNLRFRMNCDLDIALGSKQKIKEFLDELFRETRESIDKAVREMTVDATRDTSIDVYGHSMSIHGASLDSQGRSIDQRGAEQDAQQAPIIRLVNQVIAQAVAMRASDIHVEPFGNRVRLRFRVDGVCHAQDDIPKRTQAAVTARLKIMAGMKIEEKRVPQDGRIRLRIDDEPIDFRVSACPVYHGESVVLRILRSDFANLGLETLGFESDSLEEFYGIISRPNGIFLVTGPTGSGKTTTLYAALETLNRPDRKIITAEDPIEYNFPGINQCQVNDQIELNFSTILRAMLRQAPDIILVGEIRDRAVSEVAIQAALTGHLVFSTLHTNDAPSAITRLIDMGVKPFLVASSIQAVMAQRLVRILCPECRVVDTQPDVRHMQVCGLTREALEGQTIYKPGGCRRCSGTGFRGRKGIFEMMSMNAELRALAFKRAPLNQLRQAAMNTGMRSLLGDGRLKILGGTTALEEVARITQVEGVVDVSEEEQDEAA